MVRWILSCLIVFLSTAAYCQDKVDEEMQKKINAAIDKGAKWLIENCAKKDAATKPGYDSLTLLTLLHAGISDENPAIKTLVDRILKNKPADTYDIALQAMAFEKLDKITYQGRIADCGQLLIDSQAKDGRWGYTCASSCLYTTKTNIPVNTFYKKKDKKLKQIKLTRMKMAAAGYDNSNTQYAILGLRSCMDAEVIIPKDVFQLAKKWAEKDQQSDGGWDYGIKDPNVKEDDKLAQQRKQLAKLGGMNTIDFPNGSYGSMTAGMLGALAICDYYLKIDNEKDNVLSKGIDWLGDNFKADENPNWEKEALYYYLYTLERAGMLLNTDKFGNNYWYYEGAKFLLDKQKSNGSWEGSSAMETHIGQQADTCFAILFLQKATSALKEPGATPAPTTSETAKSDSRKTEAESTTGKNTKK